MLDYKIVNGKKIRICKYGCNSELVWSDNITAFIETKGGRPHTKDRCEQVKKESKQETSTYTNKEAKITAIIKMVQSIITDLEDLKK